jgi:hypothetical protein
MLQFVAMPTTSATNEVTPLWNGIATKQRPETIAGQLFVDARGISHSPASGAVMGGYYLQVTDRASIRILYRGKPKWVCGVDIVGTRADLEKASLLNELGPPTSRVTEDLLNSPGGSAALLSGGKLFQIWTWQQGSTVITFEERVRPGYFAITYRAALAGRIARC